MFDVVVKDWFEQSFGQATPVQKASWKAIDSGRDVLISAPTGSGKTFAAFLHSINRIYQELDAVESPDLKIIYVSPLKALSNDIQINLQQPLEAIKSSMDSDNQPIEAEVWTGDTPAHQRTRIRKNPPHILVTTPESLFNILTSDSGRAIMPTVDTVIIDEVHAVATNKRGAHLLLSLSRLEALTIKRPQRIAISATQKPIERMRDYILQPDYAEIVNMGHQRQLELSVELPDMPLTAVASAEQWAHTYDQLAHHIEQHKTTLIFVNNRRLSERLSRHLGERLGEEVVAAHHGSLAKEHRFDVEQKLKSGALKAMVATSSLELGIDIGDIDLVCQMGSPGSIQAFLQRVGRSGHGIGRIPKGQLYPLTLDDLVEATALKRAVAQGELESSHFPKQPLDVLAQQIVAEVAMREWHIERLYHLFASNICYQNMRFETFEGVIDMLARGFSGAAAPQKALIFYDRVQKTVRPKKSAQLTALLNGGTIPDQFDYDVRLLPEDIKIGTLNEDFSFESIPGDIFQLGNHSYRIVKIQTGVVFAEDAKGMPPNIPFWFGTQMWRSDELSAVVSDMRETLNSCFDNKITSQDCAEDLAVPSAAMDQLLNYTDKTRQVLGLFPTQQDIVIERFFDGNNDMHVVVHSVYGSRINRAWGLALRKRFCRQFNFELQAAALEDAIILSLGATHSFDLADVIHYLKPETVREVLIQALLDTPFFVTQWRWNASIALAVKRRRGDKRVLPQFQRNAAEDLVAQVFPEQIACAENIQGKRQVPDHPLVEQTIKDCTETIMDIEGLQQVLESMRSGEVRVHCVDSNTPSPASLAIINARNFAFLDDAPAEERRTLAIKTQNLNQDFNPGLITSEVIVRVNQEAMPPMRDVDELMQVIDYVGFYWLQEVQEHASAIQELLRQQRIEQQQYQERTFYHAAHNQTHVEAVLAQTETQALDDFLSNRLSISGRISFAELMVFFPVSASVLQQALLRLQNRGIVFELETDVWINRDNLSKLRQYALGEKRRYVQPASPAQWERFVKRWQRLEIPLEGLEGLQTVLTQFQGFSATAQQWEEDILPGRVSDFNPYMLDQLCQHGLFIWKRTTQTETANKANLLSLQKMPMTFLMRESQHLFPTPELLNLCNEAESILKLLQDKGALFVRDMLQYIDVPVSYIEQGLIQLIRNGLIVADGFAAMRSFCKKPADRHRQLKKAKKYANNLGYLEMMGRWSLIESRVASEAEYLTLLLQRYGVLTHQVFKQEHVPFTWREAIPQLNRLEARGEVLGGRFLRLDAGMQYALPQAYKALKKTK
ncbi:DEAD/DEAH box helicase [Marinicella sp. W31]|uniref:DEAD/DEAH box helicase n=1 Tax=Marinicella sp. W31 TaxID=3023713 RepID=UPI003757E154